MSIGDFEIEPEKERLLSYGKWFEVQNLEQSRAVFHKPDSSLLIGSNLESGTRIRSDYAVIVQGWVNGSEKSRCHIVAEGDVIVEGNVHYAHVKGRTIRIGGEAKRCVLAAAEGIEVGAEISGAKITAGDFEAEKLAIADCWQELQRIRKSNQQDRRQYAIDKKAALGQIGRTPFKLDYSIGKVVQHTIVHQTNKQIEIDLSPLYKVLQGKSEKEIDLALKEFFASGVVATLLRVNKDLIEMGPNRRKVFVGTIRYLQGLFSLVRTIDKQNVWIEQRESRLDKLVDKLENFPAGFYTRGPILPDVDIEIRHPVVDRRYKEQPTIQQKQASFSLRVGRVTDYWSVKQTSTRGEVRNHEVTPGELQATRFELDLGWLEASEMV